MLTQLTNISHPFAPSFNLSVKLPTLLTTREGWTGQAIITNLEASVPNGDNDTFSVDFTGVDELKKITAA